MILRLLQRFACRTMAARAPDFIVGGHAMPYLNRWFVIPRNRFFNIYLHEFRRSDDDRALHDHPWWWCSIILKGCYTEVTKTPIGSSVMRRWQPFFEGAVRIHRPGFAHRLVIAHGTRCVTLFITGPRLREWGFHCPRGWVPWQKFTAADDAGAVGAGCDQGGSHG